MGEVSLKNLGGGGLIPKASPEFRFKWEHSAKNDSTKSFEKLFENCFKNLYKIRIQISKIVIKTI